MFRMRNEEGFYNKLIAQHLLQDPTKFAEFFRISPNQFDFLVQLIKEDLSKQSTNVHLYPIKAEEKLAITLR